MEQKENYPWLLEEVPWSLAAEKIDGLEPFFEELKQYNKELGLGLPDYIDSELDIAEVIIIYEYYEEDGIDGIYRTEEVKLKSAFESFSEVELLYQLHNKVQRYYQDVDKHWFEGLQLIEETPELKYALVLGS